MNILVFGGFLGSGKTTVIQSFIKAALDNGDGPVAVIENEIGQVGIDDALVEGSGVTVKPLFGGCVCCEIRGALLQAIEEIATTIAPSWLIIEMTGLAVLTTIVNTLRDHARQAEQVIAVSVVDTSRWAQLYDKLDYLVTAQLSGSDAVVANKTDLCDDPQALAGMIAQIAGIDKNDIVWMAEDSDRAALCAALLRKILPGWKADLPGSPDAEDEHDEAEMEVGAFSRIYSFDDGAQEAELRQVLSGIFGELGVALTQDGIIYGHAKGVLRRVSPEGKARGFVRYSVTGPSRVDELVSVDWPRLTGGLRLVLNINSAVHTAQEISTVAEPILMKLETLGGIQESTGEEHSHDHHIHAGESSCHSSHHGHHDHHEHHEHHH